MTPVAAAGMGGLAGFVGAALAHILSVYLTRHGAADWLRGPFGPPFFTVAAYTGVFYGAIGAAAGRLAAAATGFLGGFLGVLVPLYVLTRYGGWSPQQWHYIMMGAYIVVIWGTIAGIGAQASRNSPKRGAAAAVLGSLAGYAFLSGGLAVFHGVSSAPVNPAGFLPPWVNLMDGLASGAGLCLALSLDRRFSRRTS